MFTDRLGCSLAGLAVLCVLSIFFFPAAQGPYPVVHGPVTALLSIRAAAALRVRIARGGLSALRDRLHRSLTALALWFWIPLSAEELASNGLGARCSSTLRC